MGNNWENRAKKVRKKRDNRYMDKPFRRTNKTVSDNQKNRDVQIKQAQKAKYDTIDETED